MTNEPKQQLAVWWILWATFLGTIVAMDHFIGGVGRASPPEDGSLIWLAAGVPVLVSARVRWVVLPRMASAQAALPFFIVGIALAEATCSLGLFIFQAHREDLFYLSFLGILQFVPFFARRYFPDGDDDRGV